MRKGKKLEIEIKGTRQKRKKLFKHRHHIAPHALHLIEILNTYTK